MPASALTEEELAAGRIDEAREPTMEWTRSPPDVAGFWLRINVTGRPQLHTVRLWPTDDLLHIDWGGGGERGELALPHHKMEGWWWCGPIGLPPGAVLEHKR